LIVFMSDGRVTAGEIIELFKRLQSDPDFSFSHDFFWDARKRTVPWTSEDSMILARYMNSFSIDKVPPPKRAFVYARDVDYGMGRVYEGYRSIRHDIEMGIFKDKDQALEWLGIRDHPIFRPGGRYFG